MKFLPLLLLFAVGCSQTGDTVKKFQDPVLMTDGEGNKFIVEHHLGNVYTVKPLKK